RAGGHRVRTRWRAQYPGVGSSRRNEPSPLHARVHRRGWGSARSLCRAHPHRSRPPSARGDRRHRYRHRGSLRLRQRGNPQTQLRSTAWHFARPIPQDIRLTKEMTMTQIAIVVYPGFTALDFIGPYEILRNLPDAEVRFVWHQPGPIAADSGVLLVGATHSFDETPSPDVVLVPGGMSTFEHARDEKVLEWVRRAHETSTWTTSVCSGSAILAAAGVLKGKRATSHWMVVPMLKPFGVSPVGDERIVVAEGTSRNKIVTCAGVSAGLDMALWLSGQIVGESKA